MNCIIIEDQPPAQRILQKYIEDTGTLHLMATFSDAIQALDFLKNHHVALIFLDIHLPKISGMDFLQMLPNAPHVILTTAFPNYALESYEFQVVDYLLKPFSFQRFMKSIARIPQSPQHIPREDDPPSLQQFQGDLFIKSGYEHHKITIDDIMYLKSDTDYTEIFTPQKKYLSVESLRYWLEHLDASQFIRVHRSYIINTAKCQKVVGNRIHMSDDAIIPIGRTYKEAFLNRFVR